LLNQPFKEKSTMLKNTQAADIEGRPEMQAAAVDPLESELVCAVQLQVAAVYNGHSYPSGTTIGGVPFAVAKKMEGFRTARIVGVPTPIDSHRVRDLNAVENQIPASLGLDPARGRPACPVAGQRSSVFVNTEELEALQNRR
jgi:hypothetical protein